MNETSRPIVDSSSERAEIRFIVSVFPVCRQKSVAQKSAIQRPVIGVKKTTSSAPVISISAICVTWNARGARPWPRA